MRNESRTDVKGLPVSDVERRDKAMQLLLEGAKEKLFRGGTKGALEKIGEAYELATEPHRISGPLPALIAYRRAHLLLRTPPSTREDLEEAETFMSEAVRESALGPWPRLYRLAIRRRLGDDRLADDFSKASAETLDWLRGQGQEGKIPEERRTRIQDGVINLLEICAYFLGQEYQPLEGRKGLDDNFFGEEAPWHLVGPDPLMATVRYPKRLALAELAALETHHPEAFFFLPPEEGRQGEGEWWKAGQKDRQPVGELPLRILAAILKGARTREKVREEVGGENMNADDFRVTLNRFRKKMGSLTGLDPDEFGRGDHRRLPETLTIFGAVNRFTYSRHRS